MSGANRMIPMVDLRGEVEALWSELEPALRDVVRSGRFVLGPNLERFEAEVAGFLGVDHAVGLNSGTDALVIALRALEIGPGDEVIVPAFTFFATAEAVSLVGARPVFADVDPETFCVDPKSVEAGLGPRTRALIAVHLFGQAAELETLLPLAEERGLALVEDVAQAFGAHHKGRRLGSLGRAATFSFYPSKNLGAYGDGGLLTTNDAALAADARLLRDHGAKTRYISDRIGYNSRLDEIQAAILRIKLPHVDSWNARRRQVARRYDELFDGAPAVLTPIVAERRDHVYHQYVLRLPSGRRDPVVEALRAEGIASAVHYPMPLHRMAPYAERAVSLPQSEALAEEVLSLPMWPDLAAADQERIAAVVRRCL